MTSVVSNWFGTNFIKLHPLLQKLHLRGGHLQGTIDLEFGTGFAGIIGRRLAPKIGLPLKSGAVDFEVCISHTADTLNWVRKFDNNHIMTSLFVPHGEYPTGYWSETTGNLSLELGVDIRDGGWYWVQRKVKLFGVPLPLMLFPSSHAYKRINDNLYEFSVAFTLPIIGKLVSYSGKLSAIENA
jgi:hypothetical protein